MAYVVNFLVNKYCLKCGVRRLEVLTHKHNDKLVNNT